jgi:hypothetical protein
VGVSGSRSRLGGGGPTPAEVAAVMHAQRQQQQHTFMDPEHLIVNGMGGAFMHPTHVFSYSRFAVLDDEAATATAAIYSSSGPHRCAFGRGCWRVCVRARVTDGVSSANRVNVGVCTRMMRLLQPLLLSTDLRSPQVSVFVTYGVQASTFQWSNVPTQYACARVCASARQGAHVRLRACAHVQHLRTCFRAHAVWARVQCVCACVRTHACTVVSARLCSCILLRSKELCLLCKILRCKRRCMRCPYEKFWPRAKAPHTN